MAKRYQEALAKIDRKRKYPLEEAVDLLKKLPHAKFDETVEVSVKLGIDSKQSDQAVRASISLPHGLGKKVRVIAFCEGEERQEALSAGAIEAGSDDLIKKISDGWLDFDVAVASPDQMRKVGKLGRILGPKGLMPSPKSGTVVSGVAEAVREFVAGKVEFRSDDGGNVHGPVGKLSFDSRALVENIETLLEHLRANKPASAKGVFIQKVVLSSTMGPGIPVESRPGRNSR